MAKRNKDEDAFSPFDGLLRTSDIASSPWTQGHYVPDLDLLRELLTVPIKAGDKQATGRPAKAFDAWIAHELRRAGFSPDGVWPRNRRPRVLPDDLAPLESSLEALAKQLQDMEQTDGQRLKPAALRKAIREVAGKLPGASEAYILGDFYSKQIDVAVSSWRRGPSTSRLPSWTREHSSKTWLAPSMIGRPSRSTSRCDGARTAYPLAGFPMTPTKTRTTSR